MLILLFSILWGALLTLLLCAPYSYYPLFLTILGVSIVAYFFSRRFSKTVKKHFYIASALLFIISYVSCSYVIFRPSVSKFDSSSAIAKNKKAVIFYCQGEMEKYTPYYANCFFKDKPYYLKPFYAMQIKNIYQGIEVNTKNNDLLNVARDVKNSIINYKPYYFYIALSNYVPNIKDSISTAISDGCGEITIINYTNDSTINKTINNNIDLENLKKSGIKINFTDPVYNEEAFAGAMISKILNISIKWDAILIYDIETNTSKQIKETLIKNGYDNKSVVISNDIPDSMNYFIKNNYKSLLYINLQDSGGGIESETILPKKFEKYNNDIKITGIRSWGYDKNLVKAVIQTFQKTEKNK